MKKLVNILSAAVLTAGLAASCTDLTEVSERIASLEDRVSAIESVLPSLNSNIASLQKLAGGGTINKVEENEGVYKITLTNGEVLTLNQGSIGVGKAPVMSISSDGYWMADYQDGKGAQYVLNGGNKVPSLGQDGLTPVFGVDKDGCWTVSYDGGKTFSTVKDSDGKPVKAISDESTSDSYFADVKVQDNVFVLTLRSGQTYRIPVIADFLFSIKGAEDIQLFNPGDVKSFEIEMKGVADAVFYKPQGWEVSLSDLLLTIKAPSSAPVATKATIADSASDVSVLAVSSAGYSCIAKVKVQLSGAAVEVNPVASVTAGEVTFNSASFKVLTEDVTSWKYIFQKSALAAPDAAELKSKGIAGTSQNLTFTNLESKTPYTLYVLPVNDAKDGTIASATITTLAEPVVLYADNLEAWNSGKVINIAGEKYSKATHGEATVLTAEAADTPIESLNAGVYILDCKSGCNFLMTHTSTGYVVNGDIVIIGRTAAAKPSIKFEGWAQFKGNVAMRDIKIDYSVNSKGYVFTLGAEADRFHVDGCTLIPFNANQTAYCVNYLPASIRLVNNDVKYNLAQGANGLGLSFSSSKRLNSVKEITIENNIFYNPNFAYYHIVGCNNNAKIADQTDAPQSAVISMCNNTFYNLTSSTSTGGMIYAARADVLTIDKNIFWTSCPSGTQRCVHLLTGELPAVTNFGSNVAFGLAYGSAWRYFYDSTEYLIPRVTDDPLESVSVSSMTFTTVEAYEGYGAIRK